MPTQNDEAEAAVTKRQKARLVEKSANFAFWPYSPADATAVAQPSLLLRHSGVHARRMAACRCATDGKASARARSGSMSLSDREGRPEFPNRTRV
jgi:hypothetical protein